MKHSMSIKNIFSKKNRVLLSELVRTDFKLRYQGSVLGYTWSLLRPLLMFVILYVVFALFLKVGKDVPHYPVYLLFGIVIWTFFSEMTQQSLGSIVGRGDLIRKIRIPRWIVVLSSSVSALINVGLNLIIIVVFMIINKVDVTWTVLLLPLILLQVYIFSLGVSFFLAAVFVKYRDINYMWEVFLQAGFYATPILYPLTVIKNVNIHKILFMNPMAQAIQDARYAVVTKETITIHSTFSNNLYTVIPIIITIAVFIIGALYFRSQSKSFAENL